MAIGPEREAHPSMHSLAICCAYLVAAIVALLATFTASVILKAPVPRKGKPVDMNMYNVNLTELRPSVSNWLSTVDGAEEVREVAEALTASFVQSAPDDALQRFIADSASATTTWFGRVKVYAKQYVFWCLQKYLGWSRPDANGFVRLASLYLASEQQLSVLTRNLTVHLSEFEDHPPELLDIGAGQGTETAKVARVFGIHPQHVSSVESSTSMRKSLSAHGFQVFDAVANVTSNTFAVAALLNVLDRCDHPLSLIDAAVGMLQSHGLLLVAIVLPFNAWVHEGRRGSKWGKPNTRAPLSPLMLPIVSRAEGVPSFEVSAAEFASVVLSRRKGMEIVAWTRLPYVSSGDVKRTHYLMDMALFVFRGPFAAESPPNTAVPPRRYTEEL